MGPRDRSTRVFRFLLRLLPRDFTDQFGSEMHGIFEAQYAEMKNKNSPMSRIRFWLATFSGMLRASLSEHLVHLGEDFRYAVRSLVKRPIFALTAVISLAIGLAGVMTALSFFNAAFLRPIPGITNPGELINLKPKKESEESFALGSYPNYQDLREDGKVLQDLAGFNGLGLSLELDKDPQLIASQVVTGNYFVLLGLQAWQGRLFNQQEDEDPGENAVAVISHQLWNSRFGGDASVLGQSVRINGHPFVIIGVLQPGFRGHFVGFNFDLFIPSSMSRVAGLPNRQDRSANWLELIGRLQEGVTHKEAQARMDLLAADLARAYPDTNRGLGLEISPWNGYDEDLRGGFLLFLSFLIGLAALFLLIACSNVAGVFLARLMDRRREMALRMALGARRSRIVQLILSESLLLSISAGFVAILLTGWGTQLDDLALSSFDGVISIDARLDTLTIMLGFALAISTGLLLGLAPALRSSRYDLSFRMTWCDHRSSGRARLRQVLVVAQIALCMLVLITGGLFFRSLEKAAALGPGFDVENVQLAFIQPSLIGVSEEESQRLLEHLLFELRAHPTVEAAALTNRMPLSLGARFFKNPIDLEIPGHQPPAGQENFQIEHAVVSAGFFETLRVPLAQGRTFTSRDGETSERIAIVNQTMASRFWPNSSPIGRSLETGDEQIKIVGVVQDFKVRQLDEDPTSYLYLPISQNPQTRATLIVRSRPGDQPAAAVTEVLRTLAPNLPLRDFQTGEQHLSIALLPQQIGGALAGSMGTVGLLLAAIGLYGLVAFSVRQRFQEFGIRLSVGATPGNIVKLVLRQSARLTTTGILIGILMAIPAALLLRRFLTGVSPLDTFTYVIVSVILLAVNLTASYFPARRASSVDPVSVLRSE